MELLDEFWIATHFVLAMTDITDVGRVRRVGHFEHAMTKTAGSRRETTKCLLDKKTGIKIMPVFFVQMVVLLFLREFEYSINNTIFDRFF